jgi:hypothetical protein
MFRRRFRVSKKGSEDGSRSTLADVFLEIKVRQPVGGKISRQIVRKEIWD